LEALERDHRELLLPEVVVKGFIEAYARYCGLDPKEVLSKYTEWQAKNGAAAKKKSLPEERQGVPPRYILGGVAGVIILIIASLISFSGRRVSHEGAHDEAIAKTGRGLKRVAPPTDLQSAPSRPLTTERTLLSPPPAHAQTEKNEQSSLLREHTLVIKASEKTWIQIQDGSALPFDLILYPGDNYTRTSSNPLTIVIGNAGGVEVIFDGKGLDIVGGGGAVVKLKLPSSEEG
jgi:cytoskeleton protein RodZ